VTLVATSSPIAAEASTPHVTGFVAVTTGSGSKQISSFNLDGSHERPLTTGPADHHYPSLAPDGRHLLYVGNDGDRDEIYGLDLSSPSAPRQVTSPPLVAESPSWSPNGRRIAFSAILLGRTSYQIFVADADGSRLAQITRDTVTGSSQPVFSPDGLHIAYINGRAGDDRIWVMNTDGSGARALTPGPLDAYPSWLDDSTVLFARSVPSLKHSVVVAVRLDGSERVLSPSDISLVEPRPLPDGRSYGATERVDAGLRLVTVARSDGARLDAPGDPSFMVSPIATAASAGSVFTMDWIVAPPPQVPPTVALLPFAAGAAGLGIVAVALLATRRRGVHKNERLLV
jgi:dipeptidyl aminopeptidase/acylaminoacyl peptidase